MTRDMKQRPKTDHFLKGCTLNCIPQNNKLSSWLYLNISNWKRDAVKFWKSNSFLHILKTNNQRNQVLKNYDILDIGKSQK